MTLVLGGRTEVLESYDDISIRSPSQTFALPAVIRITKSFHAAKIRPRMKFSRQHVFARDGHRCQYCQKVFPVKDLTLDHVVPVVHGGRTAWSNIVSSCMPCNQKKGSRTPAEAGLKLMAPPKEPQLGFLPDLIFYKASSIPAPWKQFLPQRLLLAVG